MYNCWTSSIKSVRSLALSIAVVLNAVTLRIILDLKAFSLKINKRKTGFHTANRHFHACSYWTFILPKSSEHVDRVLGVSYDRMSMWLKAPESLHVFAFPPCMLIIVHYIRQACRFLPLYDGFSVSTQLITLSNKSNRRSLYSYPVSSHLYT